MKHTKQLVTGGAPLEKAERALVMIHGRGGDAHGIMGLASHLQVDDYALVAPQATNRTWYPYSFLADRLDNEPWLTAALVLLAEVEADLVAAGIPSKNIYFVGFSQGACLALEYVSRYAKRYGGVVALTGGLIGPELNKSLYRGDFNGTPVYLSTGDPDAHVPVERVKETLSQLQDMGAEVSMEVFSGRPHTVTEQELESANLHVFNKLS